MSFKCHCHQPDVSYQYVVTEVADLSIGTGKFEEKGSQL